MQHPQSCHQSYTGCPPKGISTVLPFRDVLCAPGALTPNAPSPSPTASSRSSVGATTMVTPFQERAPSSRDPQPSASMNLAAPAQAYWPTHEDITASHIYQSGAACQQPLYLTPEPAFYSYGQHSLPYGENNNLAYNAAVNPNCPRSFTDFSPSGLPGPVESFPPTAYLIEPQKSHETMELSDQNINSQFPQLRADQDGLGLDAEQGQYSRCDSQYDSDVSRCSTPDGDLPMPQYNSADKEQPYAQLIYRALLEAPNHTMILRDIYDWFVKNTDKATDKEGKGWQNSIRHNLSMNGAFEKFEQPCEESKKCFMWRLTKQAILDGGVKSTTRYRTKQPNKRGKNPLSQRQASRARGGRPAARMRKPDGKGIFINDRYNPRSVPTAPLDANFDPDTSMPYPSSPYYSSSSSEVDLDYRKDDFGAPLGGSVPELFSNRSYSGSPLSQDVPQLGDTARVRLPVNPAEPLFTGSPSPPHEDGPRTPESAGVWEVNPFPTEGDPYTFGLHYFDTPFEGFPTG